MQGPDLDVVIATQPTGDRHVTRLGWDEATQTVEAWYGLACYRIGNVSWAPSVLDVLWELRMRPEVYPSTWVNYMGPPSWAEQEEAMRGVL